MPTSMIVLLAAVVAGWFVQVLVTFRQAEAFNKQVVHLRQQGTVTVGVAGRRYRGGRAYVALALDDQGTCRDAITLQGWATFARGRSLPQLAGVQASEIQSDREIPGLTHQQRDAAREALVLLDRERRNADSQQDGQPAAAAAAD
jgi:DNA-binding transcriptional regulator of glucitol operon